MIGAALPGSTASPAQASGSRPSAEELKGLLVLLNAGQLQDAQSLADAMTKRFPHDPTTWKILGVIYKRGGLNLDALVPMQKAAELAPDDAEAHNNLGVVFKTLGRLDDAVGSYRRAIEIRPSFAEAHYNLGNAWKQTGRLEEACESYRRALESNPDHGEACSNLANTLRALGRLVEAEQNCRRALKINPANALAQNNLGNILAAQGKLDEAEASYRRALQVDPNHAQALSNLAVALHDLGRLHEAETACQHALQIWPDYADALSNLGSTLTDLGRLDEAVAACQRALQIKPDHAEAYSNLLFALNYHPDKRGEDVFSAYRQYEQQFGQPHRAAWRPYHNDRTPNRRLRIGYVSPALRQHSSRHFLEPLLAQHDHNTVEVYAYAELAREDAVTARYKGYVDHWLPTQGLSDDALTQRIRDDRIDILVDVAGHTAGNRLQVFARKPAPVSLHWLDFGYTTGLSAIDYYLTDWPTVPAGSEPLFSEEPWRLDGPGLVYRPAEGMGEASPLPAAQTGHLTFGSLTRAVRINHHTVRIWAQLLQQIPTARLVINSGDYRTTAMQDELAKRFEAHGIQRERLDIGHHSPPWDVLRQIDISLDCFPHNSGTTLFESLYLGVPFVTLAGRPSVGRMGSAILHGLGHPEWIAHSEDEYVQIALAMASDLPRLATLRAGLRAEMQASPLMDEAGFARRVEGAYRGMFENWVRNPGLTQ